METSVSVLMAARNAAPWVGEAVDSILGQGIADLELICVDDGSSDGTADLLEGFGDARVKVFRQSWLGLATSLNRAARLAQAPILARMDADDVALPGRLVHQLEYLQAHPEVGLVGTGWVEVEDPFIARLP